MSRKPKETRLKEPILCYVEEPFFFKQWGEYYPERLARGPEIGVSPSGKTQSIRIRGLWPKDVCSMYRVGKKAAGRLLDGREWSEFPR